MQMSVFALSVTPYITSSIIMQLMTIVIPALEEMQKDGEDGRKRMAKITRYVTVVLAIIEGAGLAIGFANQGALGTDYTTFTIVTMIIALTAGAVLVMWLGERITAVSYTHLDVYKRQVQGGNLWLVHLKKDHLQIRVY